MTGVESSRIYNEVPAVQFRSLNQFVADLAAGVVDTVYHDVGAGRMMARIGPAASGRSSSGMLGSISLRCRSAGRR